jgi:hypothetical protein
MFIQSRRLDEESSILLLLVSKVNAIGSLAGIRGVLDGAGLPFLVFMERALEVEGMVDAREAEVDVVALHVMLAELIHGRNSHLHPDYSCHG